MARFPDGLFRFDRTTRAAAALRRSVVVRFSIVLAAWMIAFACRCPAAENAQQVEIVRGGKSDWRIVIPENPDPPNAHAADELQLHIRQMTGCTLPIVRGPLDSAARAIVVAPAERLRAAGYDLPAVENPEGYRIRVLPDRVLAAGGGARGTLYAVYGLLEDHWGCRWFAPGVHRIPQRETLSLPMLDELTAPVLEYREPYTADCFDGDWCARNRVNSSAGRLEEKHGGKVRFGRGFFVHTFERLVPPEKYFDAHPEYFSLVKNKKGEMVRLKERSQLCCTNEEVIRLCIEGIRAAIAADPSATVFSVSQNDWYNNCQCDSCQRLAEAEGSQIAPVLALVNRVAEAIEKDHPDKLIETLAYQWTRKAPKQMRPRPNVIIRLCSIECCFSHPLATCDSPVNAAFRADAAEWAKVCNRLWVWNYATDFAHYLLPFPNQRVRDDNVRFYVAHNVKGIFEQDTYNTTGGELSELGGYMTAKFLWNPNYDENKAINEFLEGFYGPAAGPIRRYIDLLHDYVEKENIHVNIWAPPTSPHLAEKLLIEADALWQAAEEAAAGQPDVLARVKRSRLSVDYAIIARTMHHATKNPPEKTELAPLALRRRDAYFENLRTSGITRLHEHKPLDFELHRKNVTGLLDRLPPAAPATPAGTADAR